MGTRNSTRIDTGGQRAKGQELRVGEGNPKPYALSSMLPLSVEIRLIRMNEEITAETQRTVYSFQLEVFSLPITENSKLKTVLPRVLSAVSAPLR